MFQLEYSSKNYSNYSDLKVKARFSQTGNSSVSTDDIDVATDICGATFSTDAPSEWLMPANIKSDLIALNVGGAYNTEKFEVSFWIEGKSDLTDDNVTNSIPHAGVHSKSKYWLDAKLSQPSLSLLAIDWTGGEQTVKVVEDGSFNNYTVYYDLSGSNGSASNAVMNDASGSSGATMEAKAEISYTYSQLLPNDAGDYKSLYVRVERPEINNLDAINPPMNKSDPSIMDYLKAVKRAAAPSVVFTPLTVDHDGSIEFAYIEASANTDLFGYLQDGVDASGHPIVVASGSGSIPLSDASNAVISFNVALSSATKYIMNAYSRLNLGDFNSQYRDLNVTKKSDAGVVGEFSDDYLLSAKTSDSNFFTEPPTFRMTVRPTGSTNKLSTVRMHGESNGNNVNRFVVFAKDVCGQVLEKEVLVGNNFEDSCGNVVLNIGGHVDNFNTSFIQDFVFDEPISIGVVGDMFLLGIIDTPSEVDAINWDITANPLTVAHNNAIIAYDAGVVAYGASLTASNEYLTHSTHVQHSSDLVGWTASAESLSALLVTTCGTLMGDEDVANSDSNVAALLAASNAEIQNSSAMTQTAGNMNTTIQKWIGDYAAATAPAGLDMKSNPVLTYIERTASGETAFAESVIEFDVPNAGYSTINLTKVYSDYVKLVEAQETIEHTAGVDWNKARLANQLLKDKVDILNGILSVVGSIKHANAGVDAANDGLTVLLGGFATAIHIAKKALYGHNSSLSEYGTIAAPLIGSHLHTMNAARKASSDEMDGIEMYNPVAAA
jgi:hypothetical protein